MTVEIKELIFDNQYLVNLTDAESSEINGGYAAAIATSTGSLTLAAQASGIVFGRSASDRQVFNDQVRAGIPFGLIQRGIDLANNFGGGVYTVPVTAAKLEG